ncbi:Peroxin 13, N-terminal region-domain-containing protein [Globomyces pollinis-pini]|nr:Peroxin 13, N-terminal region-domain-containing protein [Globomyces pollinis-pini]
MTSPPKPWEQANAASNIAPAAEAVNTNPALPVRPTSISTMNRPGFGTYPNSGTYGAGYGNSYGNSYGSGYGATNSYGGGYGTTYGGMGSTYGNSYGSGYGMGMNRYGAGYGGTYGGYGSSYGMGAYGNRMGMNGMGGMPMQMGPNGMPMGDPSLTQRMAESTQSTFQMLDQIVQAFGGFSQMLESTFFSTHSSFMAMMGVADQFGQLRGYLGQVFSFISVYNTLKRFIYRITGNAMPVDTKQLTTGSFEDFSKEQSKPKYSKKPLMIFLSLVIGLPWLLSKLIKKIDENRSTLPTPIQNGPIAPSDISQLEFCKAEFDFQSDHPADLSIRKGDLIAILSKLDPATNAPSDWWRGRTQDGRVGMFPHNYVQIIQKRDSSTQQVTASNPNTSNPNELYPNNGTTNFNQTVPVKPFNVSPSFTKDLEAFKSNLTPTVKNDSLAKSSIIDSSDFKNIV